MARLDLLREVPPYLGRVLTWEYGEGLNVLQYQPGNRSCLEVLGIHPLQYR